MVFLNIFGPDNILRLSWPYMNNIIIRMICSLINPHPNTYTFSKRLAEDVVSDFYPQLPVVIVRPSIGMSIIIRKIFFDGKLSSLNVTFGNFSQ